MLPDTIEPTVGMYPFYRGMLCDIPHCDKSRLKKETLKTTYFLFSRSIRKKLFGMYPRCILNGQFADCISNKRLIYASNPYYYEVILQCPHS